MMLANGKKTHTHTQTHLNNPTVKDIKHRITNTDATLAFSRIVPSLALWFLKSQGKTERQECQ